jgi:hypothetical protein
MGHAAPKFVVCLPQQPTQIRCKRLVSHNDELMKTRLMVAIDYDLPGHKNWEEINNPKDFSK